MTESIKRHDWKETGEQQAHVDFTYLDAKKQHRRCLVMAHYVRCACGGVGFRKPGSRVVYTWQGGRMLARTDPDLAAYIADNYGTCDRDKPARNDCYWGKDAAGRWNGCLRVGWLGRACPHWHPDVATDYAGLMESVSSPQT